MKKAGDRVTEEDLRQAEDRRREALRALSDARKRLQEAQESLASAQEYEHEVRSALKYGGGVLR